MPAGRSASVRPTGATVAGSPESAAEQIQSPMFRYGRRPSGVSMTPAPMRLDGCRGCNVGGVLLGARAQFLAFLFTDLRIDQREQKVLVRFHLRSRVDSLRPAARHLRSGSTQFGKHVVVHAADVGCHGGERIVAPADSRRSTATAVRGLLTSLSGGKPHVLGEP